MGLSWWSREFLHIPYLYVKSEIIAVQISVCKSEFAGSKTVLFDKTDWKGWVSKYACPLS